MFYSIFFQHKKGRVSWRPMRIPAAPWGAETKTDGVSFCDTTSVGLVGVVVILPRIYLLEKITMRFQLFSE